MKAQRRQAGRPALMAGELAHLTCDRLGIRGNDRAFFLTVFTEVRDAELSGTDTEQLWRRYRGGPAADLATAAYIEGVASTRVRQRAVR